VKGYPVVNSHRRDGYEATALERHATAGYVPAKRVIRIRKKGREVVSRFEEIQGVENEETAVLLYEYMQPCKKGSCGES